MFEERRGQRGLLQRREEIGRAANEGNARGERSEIAWHAIGAGEADELPPGLEGRNAPRQLERVASDAMKWTAHHAQIDDDFHQEVTVPARSRWVTTFAGRCGIARRVRVALVHDWLVTWRGGEKVLAALAELYPQAPIYTLFHDAAAMPASLESHPIVSSFLDRWPGARSRHRQFLPLMPAAIRSLELGPVDLVISSSHCVAKGVQIPEGARHLSYVHAPLRYMWDRFDDYFGPGKASPLVRLAARGLRPAFQAWDVSTAGHVDRFVANSAHVAAQIAERYQRFATVVHPPVELERFTASSLEGVGKGGYFLCLGALAPYKRIDLAIDAFRTLGWPLWIGGTGQSEAWLRSLPPNVKVLGQVSDADLPELYSNARALIFPGLEDFGITPLEAQASGRPVVAYRGGGALETVTGGAGLFFDEQTPEALVRALRAFETFEATFDPASARAHAERFTKQSFQAGIQREVEALGRGD